MLGAHRKNRIHQRWNDNLFDFLATLILIIAVMAVAYPLVYVVSASFSSTDAVMAGKVWLLPVEPTVIAYQAVFKYNSILTGYMNSLIYMVAGTFVNLLFDHALRVLPFAQGFLRPQNHRRHGALHHAFLMRGWYLIIF